MLTPQDLGFVQRIPKLSSKTANNGSRTYSVPGHRNLYKSVTTLIGKFAPKWGLQKWTEDLGEEESVRVRNRCATVGTKVHKLNECYFDRSPYTLVGEEAPEVITRHKLFLPILEKLNPLLIEEKMYWSDATNTMGFGGTPDIIGAIKEDLSTFLFEDKDRTIPFTGLPVGSVFVADYKNFLSAKSPNRLLEKYLQAAAYSMAVCQRSGGSLNPEHGLILATTKTMLNVFYITPSQMRWYKYFMQKMAECDAFNTKFDWKTFSEFSEGYMMNPNANWEADGQKKWVDREENYLSKKLYTPKVSKAELAELQVPYLIF